MKKLFNSLAFRVIAPIFILIFLMGWGLYSVVLRSVSDFAENQILKGLAEMSSDIHGFCDHSLEELLKTGTTNDEKAVTIKKGLTLARVDDFMKRNNLQGLIIERGEEILKSENLRPGLSELVRKRVNGRGTPAFQHEGKSYYVINSQFEPWNWQIVLLQDSSSYSALLRKVNTVYGITGIMLALAAGILVYYLERTIRYPVKSIIATLERDEYPEYRGINEFEFLSSKIKGMMESLQQETRILNNIYHIAVSKRGTEFFDEVTTGISRLFHLNALIARVDTSGDGTDAEVVSLYMNGDFVRGISIPLKGTPCEGVVVRKHMVVVEKGAWRDFPETEILARLKAESYIGFGVFNRKGEVIGIVNAFGEPREFTEPDIKVLQTIGQMVAAEFERIDEEQERVKIREQLFQAQKMEAVGTLAGGVAHDFNNMLQGILGYASLLKIKVPKSDPLYKPLQVIEHSAERAAELTKQLLGFARKGKYVLEPVSLNDIVGDVVKIIARTFDKSIEIATKLEHDLWTVLADRNQLEHSILNLCLNARDAMPEGGALQIETLNETMGEVELPYPWMKAGRYTVVKVRDTGRGMDEEVRRHIFEPFFTTKEKGKGTGMGLAMTYGVVKSHDGFITADSEVGRGSLFTIYLPTVDMKPVRETAEVKELPRGTGTILVVDDEEVIRSLARDILQELGYNVLEACDGQEALALYTSKGSGIDLVILDLVMPKMGGAEAFQRLKSIDPHVRVLVSSGYEVEEKTGEMINDKGIVGFIQKPYNTKEIAETIRNVLSSA